jgi:hypothetical protein
MKKSLTKKLELKKTTVIDLDREAQENIVGGYITGQGPRGTCGVQCPLTTQHNINC